MKPAMLQRGAGERNNQTAKAKAHQWLGREQPRAAHGPTDVSEMYWQTLRGV